MNKLRKLTTVAAAVMIIITAAAFLTSCRSSSWHLVLSDAESGQRYASYAMQEGETFSVEFIHSVNKSPVRDVYELRDGKIWNVSCIYYGFGAGVEEILGEGESLTYGENGEMIISNINQETTGMIYVVGTVSDHVLAIGSETVSLRELCGRSSKVCFTCQQEY